MSARQLTDMAIRLRWLSTAPFGRPVVPEKYRRATPDRQARAPPSPMPLRNLGEAESPTHFVRRDHQRRSPRSRDLVRPGEIRGDVCVKDDGLGFGVVDDI